MENRNEIEFDLMQMVRFLLKKLWIILIVTVIFAVVGHVISQTMTVPQYKSHSRIYVYQKPAENDEASVDYNGIVIASQLANDCEVLITGINVTQEVVDQLGLSVSPSYISDRITVSSEKNTRIIQIEYTDTDPQRAAAILNTILEVATVQIKTIVNADVVSIVYEAQVPAAPMATTVDRDTILAAAIGALLSIGVLVIVFLMDDTIRNEDDVDRYLGLSTLSAVPICPNLDPTIKNNETKKGKHLARIIKK